MLHAITYGAHHVAVMMAIHTFFPGRHQAKGQAIYTSIAYGIGGALGSVFSGYTWEKLGAEVTFAISAGAALAAFILLAWRMPGSDNQTIK